MQGDGKRQEAAGHRGGQRERVPNSYNAQIKTKKEIPLFLLFLILQKVLIYEQGSIMGKGRCKKLFKMFGNKGYIVSLLKK